MTELQLYQFIQDNNIEHRKQKNGKGENDVLVWLFGLNIEWFSKLLGDDILSEGGIDVTLTQGGYIALYMKDVCDCFGIEINNVFKENSNT